MISCESLYFPISSDETATSYVSRLTQYCGLTRPQELCLDFGFRWQDFVLGDEVAIERLSEITGQLPKMLGRWAVKTIAPQRFEIAGQQAIKGSFARSRLRVCPHCLIEDYERSGKLGPFQRPNWLFHSTRACRVHQVPLITQPSEKYTIHNYDFLGQVQKHWFAIGLSDVSAFGTF